MATKDFLRSDGQQNFIHPMLAPVSEPETMVNYISRPLRAKMRRTGYETFLNLPEAGDGYAIRAFTFRSSNVSHPGLAISYIFRFAGAKIYAYLIGGVATTWGSSIHTFDLDPDGISMEFFQNAVFVASRNGSNPLFYIRLSATDVLEVVEEEADEAPVNPKSLAVFTSCLWTDDKEVPYRLRRSSIGYGSSPDLGSPVVPFDANQWLQNDNDPATARFYDIDPDTNGTIAGIKNVNNRVIPFMGSETGAMGMHKHDFDSLTKIPTKTSIRPNGQDTIQIAEDGSAHFANNLGVYSFAGDKPVRVSLPLGAEAEDINPGAAVDFEGLYMVSLNSPVTLVRDGYSITLENPVIVHDTIADEFMWWDTGHRMTGYGVIALDSDSQSQLYSIDEDGNTYLWNNNNNDAGKVIDGYLGYRAYYGESITRPLALTSVYAISDNPNGQKIKVKKFDDDKYSSETTLVNKIQQISVEGISHTRSLSILVTTSINGKSPTYLGHSFDYMEEKPDGSGLHEARTG